MSLAFSIIIFFFSLLFYLTSPLAYAKNINGLSTSSTTTISPKEQAKFLIKSNNYSSKTHTNDEEKTNLSKVNIINIGDETNQFSFFADYRDTDYLRLRESAGYIDLQSSARMFYFFFKSSKPNDPVVLWLNGELGTSSNIATLKENGPFRIALVGGEFILSSNEHGWDTISNIIFVDHPMGTGYSFVDDDNQIRRNQNDVVNDLYDFLQQFFSKHEAYVERDLFIAGQAFAGHYIPLLALKIIQENPRLRLKGISMGNALIDLGIQFSAIPLYARVHNLITLEDEEGFHQGVESCQSSTINCEKGDVNECLEAYHICYNIFEETFKISQRSRPDINSYDIREEEAGYNASNYNRTTIQLFFNQESVENDLNVPNKEFVLVNKKVYEALIGEWAKNTHTEIGILLEKGYKVLNYVGNWDLMYNPKGLLKTTEGFQWLGQDTFQRSSPVPFVINQETVGEMKKQYPLTYIELHGAGHFVSMDKPKIALEMMRRWIEGEFD